MRRVAVRPCSLATLWLQERGEERRKADELLKAEKARIAAERKQETTSAQALSGRWS